MYIASLLRKLTCLLESHSVTSHPSLPQPKLVLDLATEDGCKAELPQLAMGAHNEFRLSD